MLCKLLKPGKLLKLGKLLNVWKNAKFRQGAEAGLDPNALQASEAR